MAEAQDLQAGSNAPISEGSGLPFGPVAAVFIASGIGAVVLGLAITLAEASSGVKSALEWNKSVGPLTGKALLATAAFFISWGILHAVWRTKDLAQRKVWMWTTILIAIGLLLTFPIFFQLFAAD
jgi:hypothetical protein